LFITCKSITFLPDLEYHDHVRTKAISTAKPQKVPSTIKILRE